MMVLNKTCRFCLRCDLLIAHRDDVKALLAGFFAQRNPKAVGNDYFIVGTLHRNVWRQSREQPMEIRKVLKHLHEFKEMVRFEPVGGWRPA